MRSIRVWKMLAAMTIAGMAIVATFSDSINIFAAGNPPLAEQETIESYLPLLSGSGSQYTTPVPTSDTTPIDTPTPTITPTPTVTSTPTSTPTSLPTPDNAIPLAYEVITPGMLAASGEEVAYSFDAQDGDTVLVTLASREYNIFNQHPFSFVLKGPDGRVRCDQFEDTELLYLGKARSTCELDLSGTYFVIVTGTFENDGRYDVYLQKLSTVPIPFDEQTLVNIKAYPHVATYSFQAEPGDWINIGARSAVSFAPRFDVFNQNRVSICFAEAGPFVPSIQACYFPNGGTYTVRAENKGWEIAGEMVLTLQKLNDPASTNSIVTGQLISDSIETRGDIDVFAFDATAGEVFNISLVALEGEIWRHFALYDSMGVVICDAVPQLIFHSSVNCKIINSGTHWLAVRDRDGVERGTYNLRLTHLSPPPSTPVLTIGSTVDAAIDTRVEHDVYRLQGEPFTEIEIQGTAFYRDEEEQLFQMYVSVLSPKGDYVCDGWGYGQMKITCELLSAEPYTLYVKDFASYYTSSYTLTVQLTEQ